MAAAIVMKNLVIGSREAGIAQPEVIISSTSMGSNGAHGDREVPVIYCAQMHGSYETLKSWNRLILLSGALAAATADLRLIERPEIRTPRRSASARRNTCL